MQEFFDDEQPISIAVLGSTGSVGEQTLEIVRSYPDRFKVVGLAARSDAERLLAQAKEFSVPVVGLSERKVDHPSSVELIDGADAAAEVAERSEAQIVVNAVVGAAGLRATLATLKSGRILALANKESLVAAGELVMAKAEPGQIRPIDSEHSALWQLLEGLRPDQVKRALITGSGGPFRGRRREDLAGVSVEDALAHPTWEMGRKITIDSATLMNKGLEVIEAHFLFGFTYDEIEVVIHPQSIVHAMVEARDGAVYAHAAMPDMKLPIQIALVWPERLPSLGGRIDWSNISSLEFEAPDADVFPTIAMAYEAGRKGDTYPAAMNAANEVAVHAFLERRIGFLDITDVVSRVLEEHSPVEPTLEGVLEQDAWARDRATKVVESLEGKA